MIVEGGNINDHKEKYLRFSFDDYYEEKLHIINIQLISTYICILDQSSTYLSKINKKIVAKKHDLPGQGITDGEKNEKKVNKGKKKTRKQQKEFLNQFHEIFIACLQKRQVLYHKKKIFKTNHLSFFAATETSHRGVWVHTYYYTGENVALPNEMTNVYREEYRYIVQ